MATLIRISASLSKEARGMSPFRIHVTRFAAEERNKTYWIPYRRSMLKKERIGQVKSASTTLSILIFSVWIDVDTPEAIEGAILDVKDELLLHCERAYNDAVKFKEQAAVEPMIEVDEEIRQ